MAIALVQTSATAHFAATLSTATTLNAVTSGNTLILLVTHANFSATNGSNIISAADAQGAYGIDQETAGGRFSCDILRLPNANAGTHTVTLTANYGTAANSYGQAVLTEWSGIQNYDTGTGVDQEATSNTGPVSTGATGALSTATDMVVGVSFAGSQSSTFPIAGWGTPSGYTSIYLDATNNYLPTSMAYKILASAAGVTTNFGTLTTSGPGEWTAAEVAYLPSGGGGGGGRNSALMMMGMGS